MPDSRPRPPLDAWDGIVIAIADFAAMVAAAVNATSAERRVARSLSIAATAARRCARRGRAGAAYSFDASATRSVHIHRARISHHTITIDRSRVTPFAHRTVASHRRTGTQLSDIALDRSSHSTRAPDRLASSRRRLLAHRLASFDVPRGERWFESSSRTSSSSSCVVTRVVTRTHPSSPSIDRARSVSSLGDPSIAFTLESRIVDASPHARDRSHRSRRGLLP